MTWTPTWTPEEKDSLKSVQERNQKREAALKEIFPTDDDKPRKWKWPENALEIVKNARKDRTLIEKLITRDLEDIYTWPTKELARDDVLIEGKGAFLTFDRKKTWLQDQGFHKFQTHYTFSDNWDKKRIPVTIFVHTEMPHDHKAPVMWFFHGGGFCTGAGDFPAWYSQTSVKRAIDKGAIIIAPDYPLGPEGNYKDIVDSIQDFLHWYKEDGCFEPGFEKWTKWLYSQLPNQKFNIDKDHVYIEGESAGGHAAVTAMWLNANTNGTNLPIDAALLRYPMIAHYARDWDKLAEPRADKKVAFVGSYFTREEVDHREGCIDAVITELERLKLVPTCPSRWPAVGMAFAFVLSVTKKWQSYFQRQHIWNKVAEKDRRKSDYMDGIERAKLTHGDVIHDLLPPIYIIHGNQDPNCLPEDTKKFEETLREKYPTRYEDDKTLRLDIVEMIAQKPVVDNGKIGFKKETKVEHAFDYSLEEKNEKFLRDAYDWIGAYWKPSNSDSLSSSLKD